MEELELEFEKINLISNIYHVYYYEDKIMLAEFFGIDDDQPNIEKFMKTKTIDEVIDIAEKLSKQHKWVEISDYDRVRNVIDSIKKIDNIRNKTNKTDIAIIKDHVQKYY